MYIEWNENSMAVGLLDTGEFADATCCTNQMSLDIPCHFCNAFTVNGRSPGGAGLGLVQELFEHLRTPFCRRSELI